MDSYWRPLGPVEKSGYSLPPDRNLYLFPLEAVCGLALSFTEDRIASECLVTNLRNSYKFYLKVRFSCATLAL